MALVGDGRHSQKIKAFIFTENKSTYPQFLIFFKNTLTNELKLIVGLEVE